MDYIVAMATVFFISMATINFIKISRQGAVGIATGRMLSTLGVHVVVYSPKEELTVVAMEEKLYKLCGEAFTRVESGKLPWQPIKFKLSPWQLNIISMETYENYHHGN